MNEIKFIIYGYKCILTGKWYVGQTIYDMKSRSNSTGSGYINSTKFWKAIQEFGWENFEPFILEENILSLEEANVKEKFWINEKDSFRDGYNGTEGGRAEYLLSETHKANISKALSNRKLSSAHITNMKKSLTGRIQSEETRLKRSKTMKEKGFHLPEETRKKISEKNKGIIFSDETRKKMSIAKKGKNISETHRKNISKATKGENNPMYGRERKNDPSTSKKVLMIDKNTNEVLKEFASVSDAGRYLGKGHGNIANCCRHESKSAYGFLWEYKENFNKEN